MRTASGSDHFEEIEIAYATEQQRDGGPRPTCGDRHHGKTTTRELAVAMLRAGGIRSLAVGNTDVPFIEALEQPLDVYVVECTSFRLAWSEVIARCGGVVEPRP